jgi:hypothetical protein
MREFLVERCLNDLQMFIEYCDNVEEVTLWITKLLFACQSFDEAKTSMEKVTFDNDDLKKIEECLHIYSGDF